MRVAVGKSSVSSSLLVPPCRAHDSSAAVTDVELLVAIGEPTDHHGIVVASVLEKIQIELRITELCVGTIIPPT